MGVRSPAHGWSRRVTPRVEAVNGAAGRSPLLLLAISRLQADRQASALAQFVRPAQLNAPDKRAGWVKGLADTNNGQRIAAPIRCSN